MSKRAVVAMRDRAIEQFRQYVVVPKGAVVSVSRGAVNSSEVRDKDNRYVLPYDDSERWTGDAVVFFVDWHPRTNWRHDCTYVFVFADGRAYVWPHTLPPNDEIEMEELENAECSA